MKRPLSFASAVLLSIVGASSTRAQQEDWNTRERRSLESVVYPQIATLPAFTQIKETLEKALAQDVSAALELRSLVGHANEYVAMAAARALGRFPGPAAAALLKQTLGTEQRPLVRGGALIGLARMRDPDVSGLATSALADPDFNVQSAGISALRELGDPANSRLLLIELDRDPTDALVLEALGSLGDLPGSTGVRDRLVAVAFKKSNEFETRMSAALALRTMGREDLVRPLFDYEAVQETYESLHLLERRINALAVQRGLTVKSAAGMDTLLRDVLASDTELDRQHGKDGWGRTMRGQLVGTGKLHVVSGGPDGEPDTSDDISLAEPSGAYVKRVFPDLF